MAGFSLTYESLEDRRDRSDSTQCEFQSRWSSTTAPSCSLPGELTCLGGGLRCTPTASHRCTVSGSRAATFGTWMATSTLTLTWELEQSCWATRTRPWYERFKTRRGREPGSLLTIRWNWKLPNSWPNSCPAPKWFGSARGEGKPTPWQSALPELRPGAIRSCFAATTAGTIGI